MTITDLLTELGRDPQKLEVFREDPLRLIKDKGLKAEDWLTLGFSKEAEKFSAYEDGMFYADFNDGAIIYQLVTKAPIQSETLPNLQVGWKISENGQLQMNRPLPVNAQGQVIIEGGQEVDLPTNGDSQRNRVWIVDQISGNCYPADILHLKVLVYTEQGCC